jgi:predicted transcriptional regulator
MLNLFLIRRKLTIQNIQNSLNLSEGTANQIIEFLIRFGFVVKNKYTAYLTLSDRVEYFLKEIEIEEEKMLPSLN